MPTPQPSSTFRPAAVGESRPAAPTSSLEFNVHPGLDEIRRYAEEQGWTAKGWKQLSVYGVDLVYTTDNWRTTRSLRSSEVPSPYVNGHFQMPDVPKGSNVEFAIKCYVGASDPHDIGGHRARGEVWLNNGGRNYTQISR